MSGNSREVGNSPKAQNSNEENSSGVGKSSDYYSFQKAIINIKNSRNIHTRSPIPFTPANSNTASQIPKADNSKVILANTYG